MRLVAASLALAALTIPTAASSTTIVQMSSNHAVIQGGFSSFDTSLGTLNSVTLTVNTDDNREIFVSSYPDDTPIDFSWHVNGGLLVFISAFFAPANYPGGPFVVPLFGSGSATNSLGASFRVTGTATFSLDPAFFLIDYFPGYWIDIVVGSSDPGFYNNGDITVTTDHPERVILGGTSCQGGDEECNFTNYTLTYDYTPFPSTLPEPATWAMMLLGFGTVGAALRRNRRNSPDFTKDSTCAS